MRKKGERECYGPAKRGGEIEGGLIEMEKEEESQWEWTG